MSLSATSDISAKAERLSRKFLYRVNVVFCNFGRAIVGFSQGAVGEDVIGNNYEMIRRCDEDVIGDN